MKPDWKIIIGEARGHGLIISDPGPLQSGTERSTA